MIYPDVSIKQWIKKYPFLKTITSTCEACGVARETNRPFISKEYVGFKSRDCPCGKSTHTAMFMVPICKKEIARWDAALGDESDDPQTKE